MSLPIAVVACRCGCCDRTVVVVDDGVATGVTDTAAIRAIRRQRPRRLILAVPVCAPDSLARLRKEADEMICLIAPPRLRGEWASGTGTSPRSMTRR